MLPYVRYLATLLTLLVCAVASYAQTSKRALAASKTMAAITIDGKLNEAVWQDAEAAVGFVQNAPTPGAPSAQRSAVKIVYDNSAIYVGAMMYDKHPDSILRQLSPRDDYQSNNDAFGISFDTYLDNQNGTAFFVTAAGVQADAIMRFDGMDFSWNAAWFSRVSFSDSGWCVEIKIPYSALRFPKKAEQQWGVNFLRIIRRHREKSYWSNVQPNIANIISQSGVLNGISYIESPIRLAFLPYISAYTENYAGSTANSLNGGMDIKYGINESFTLDMTLIPDFGQTLYDNKVLNLSPIEVRYDERRYFFTEGTSLFNKNDLFYSRRIGGLPVNYGALNSSTALNEIITENPLTTRLYNAAKISGRTKHNLGIGVLNAVSAPAYALLRDTLTGREREVLTSPLTNYNVVVLDQALKNNSVVSFINTNVTRADNNYDANVSAVLFQFANKQNRYGISGSTDVSQIFLPSKTDVGYRYALNAGKISGNYTWQIKTQTVSDRFNPNDLGYLGRNNFSYYILDQNYNTYKPGKYFINTFNNIGIKYYRNFNPDAYQLFTIDALNGVTFKNFLTAGISWSLEPFEIYDFYEPRTFGRYYIYPGNYMAGGFISSDYRKKFALDVESNYRWFDIKGRSSWYWNVSPRYRFNDKLSMIYSFDRNLAAGNVGFVNNVNDSIYLGTRDVTTFSNTLDASYIFTSTMALRLSARHYWSKAEYSKYERLKENGRLDSTGYNTNHNISFNSFNVFMALTWQFRPGSEMSVVYQNSIYATGSQIETNYFNDLNYTLKFPQSNSLSVKIIYFLDYLTLRGALKRH
ncbi:MAG: DUF5916 domain-containing protein [Bacteroidota bacterium]